MSQNKLFQSVFGFSKEQFLKPTYYDSETKEIVGAKEGTLVWWHEKGHQAFETHPKTSSKDYSRQSMWKCAVFFTVGSLFLDILKYSALSFLLANIYYAVYEEIWCWLYGLRKYKKQQLKKPKPEVLQHI